MHATRVPPQHRGGRVRKVRQRFDPRHVERLRQLEAVIRDR